MTDLTPPFGVEEVLRRLAIGLGVTLQNYLNLTGRTSDPFTPPLG